MLCQPGGIREGIIPDSNSIRRHDPPPFFLSARAHPPAAAPVLAGFQTVLKYLSAA